MKYVKTFERFALNEKQDIDFSELMSGKQKPSEFLDNLKLELEDEGKDWRDELNLTREQEALVDEFSKLEEECVKFVTSGKYSKIEVGVGSPTYKRRIEILKKLGVTDTSEFEERWKTMLDAADTGNL